MKNITEMGNGQFKRKILAQSLALALGTTLLGSALPALAAAPLSTSYTPVDNSAGALVNVNLFLGFDQLVNAAAGKNVVIRKSADNSVVETIAANDTTKITLSGSKTSIATINPSADLAYSTGYYVQIDAGAFVNSGGEAFAGIADTTSWNFTTASGATVTAYAPANGSTDVARTADLSMSFSSTECVTPAAGKNIVITKFSGNSVVETIAVNDAAKVTLSCSKQSVVVSTTNVIINPGNDLLFNTRYFVQIDSGAFKGVASGAPSYAGILDNSTWTFTTVPDTVAPTVPAGLKATTVGATQVDLLWTASTDNAGVTAYKVYRNGFLVATRGDVTNYGDTGLSASTPYSYAVAACDAAGNCSSPSTPVSATTAAAPPPSDTQAPTVPTGLSALVTGTSAIFLNWNVSTDNVGVTAYKVYRGGTPLAALGNVTSYTDTGLTASTPYNYAVVACDRAGNCSEQSSGVSATTKAPPTLIDSTTEVVLSENPNVTVDSKGALVIISKPDDLTTVVLKPDAAENVDVKLPSGLPVLFSSNGVVQQITDLLGNSQFVTSKKDGVTQVELVKGQMQVDADKSGTNVSVTTTGTLVTSIDKTTVSVVKDETTVTFYVDGGKIDYVGGNKTVGVYLGENGSVDAGGNLNQLTLGSKDGKKQVPGDPLTVDIPKDETTRITNLEGNLPRFNNTVTLLDILGDMIKEVLGDTSGQLSYDKATGVVTYKLGHLTIRLVALGDVLVQLNQFAAGNISATAGGAFSLASRGIQMSLSGALGYFSDLQSEVRKLDSNAQLSLKSTGAIEIRLASGRFVVLPSLLANLPANPTPLPGFEADASGYAVFRDHTGALQSLYPTFLEADSLSLAFAPLAPDLSVTNLGNGTVTIGWQGPSFTVVPNYAVVDSPVGHDGERYWIENETVYVRNSDQSAQGFRLQ